MKVGTKSILFGAHCWFIHPWFVAWAWWRLYGFPFDPRLWIAFIVHDLGYWGKPNMDGKEGETHVEFGATISHLLCDLPAAVVDCFRPSQFSWDRAWRWHNFCLYHSRFYAKKDGAQFSRLCVADKLAIVLTPAWLYLPMARATGEIHEYRKLAKDSGAASKYLSMNIWSADEKQWYLNVQSYLRTWVNEHRDCRPDTWTPESKVAQDSTGVWK